MTNKLLTTLVVVCFFPLLLGRVHDDVPLACIWEFFPIVLVYGHFSLPLYILLVLAVIHVYTSILLLRRHHMSGYDLGLAQHGDLPFLFIGGAISTSTRLLFNPHRQLLVSIALGVEG